MPMLRMLRTPRDGGGEIDAQDSVDVTEAVPDSPLSDRHEYVLALFKYGLVDSPQDLAVVMSVTESEARRMCGELIEAGLLDGEAAKPGG